MARIDDDVQAVLQCSRCNVVGLGMTVEAAPDGTEIVLCDACVEYALVRAKTAPEDACPAEPPLQIRFPNSTTP